MSNRSLEDQAAAIEGGYQSTTEWAVVQLIRKVQQLEQRVTALEPQKAGGFPPEEVIEGDDVGA